MNLRMALCSLVLCVWAVCALKPILHHSRGTAVGPCRVLSTIKLLSKARVSPVSRGDPFVPEKLLLAAACRGSFIVCGTEVSSPYFFISYLM